MTDLPSSIPANIPANILALLGDLEGAVANLKNTWRPEDPAYRADVYRQTMASLSYAYFMYFHADAEHPDWAPLWNPVYTLQPNPDDIYTQSPIRGDLVYRVSGNRGTCKILSFTTQLHLSGTVDEQPRTAGGHLFPGSLSPVSLPDARPHHAPAPPRVRRSRGASRPPSPFLWPDRLVSAPSRRRASDRPLSS